MRGSSSCSPPKSSTWTISGAAAMSRSRMSGKIAQSAAPSRSSKRFALISFTSCRPPRVRKIRVCLTGQAYEGHYFWDTEIYLLPFLTYTSPRTARNLLTFRYKMLPQARARARQLGHRGAMFPWRSISGEEASAYYAAGTAQYHINADIMYALRKYVQATGDEPFLRECGAEMLVETARLWLDLGFYSKTKGGKFCINGVTGPDEYNAV